MDSIKVYVRRPNFSVPFDAVHKMMIGNLLHKQFVDEYSL